MSIRIQAAMPIARGLARAAFVLAVGAAGAVDAGAVTNDLQCFKVTNENLKGVKAVVDLTPPSAGLASGCKLTKAKLYCVPTDAAVQPGTLFDGKRPGETLPFFGSPTDRAQVCYGVKCKKPNGTVPDQPVTSRFGTHRFKKLETSLVCMPLTTAKNEIRSPEVQVEAGQQVVYCYYFRMTNNAPVAVKTWRSRMPPEASKITVFLTNADKKPPGTQSGTDCGIGGIGNDLPAWAYSADQPETEFTYPPDDGTGTPVAGILAAQQAGFVRILYENGSDTPVTAHVEIDVIPYDEGAAVTRADSFITFNGNISIPPGSLGDVETNMCSVPAGAKFFSLSTHSHQRSVRTLIKDGAATVFESDDFASPGSVRFDSPPFFTFASGKLTYECRYNNPGINVIQTGDSFATDEQCVGVGFFFPSTKSTFCFNNFVVP